MGLMLHFPNGNSDVSRYGCQLLSMNAETASDRMEYKMRLSIRREDDRRVYSSYFTELFAGTTNSLLVAAKVENFNRRMDNFFPFATNVPHLKLSDEPDRCWKVILPPGTFLYVDLAYFWATLGFDPDMVKTVTLQLEGRNELAEVYGFWNDSPRLHTYSSPEVYGEELLGVLHAHLVQDLQNRPRKRVTMELGWKKHMVFPLALEGQRGLSGHEAVHALSELIDRGLRLASVDDQAISLAMNEDDDLTFQSKTIPDCPITLEFVMLPPLDEFLKNPGLKLFFPLADERVYTFRTRSLTSDPLDELYPIAIVCTTAGEAKHFLPGFGQVSLIGHMANKDDCCRLEPMQLDSESMRYFTLFLVDRNNKKIVFKENLYLNFVFEMEISS